MQQNANMRGAVFMMISMAGFVLNDTMIKLISSEIDLYQAVFLRGIMASALLGVLAWHKGALSFRPTRHELKIISWRTFSEVGATFCFLTALFNMPLANATAILQSLPLAVPLAASIFLGQRVGWRRYLAILIGFCGVLLIIKPGTDGFSVYSMWALGAVGFVTLRDLLSYKLSPQTPSIYVALFTALAVMLLAGAASSTQDWQDVSLTNAIRLMAASGFILVGYISAVVAMRHGDIAVVSPFRYSVMIWALLLGIFVFGETPDMLTILGTAIIIATGVFTFYRERKAR